eukprot:403373241
MNQHGYDQLNDMNDRDTLMYKLNTDQAREDLAQSFNEYKNKQDSDFSQTLQGLNKSNRRIIQLFSKNRTPNTSDKKQQIYYEFTPNKKEPMNKIYLKKNDMPNQKQLLQMKIFQARNDLQNKLKIELSKELRL